MIRPALVLSFISTASFAQTYSVVPIQAPAGFTNVTMIGINSSGQVAGTGTSGTITQAFIGSASGSTVIPLPSGWPIASAVAINASGQVAGTASNGLGISQAYIGTPSGITLIPFLPGWVSSSATAVNDSGQVLETGFLGIISIPEPAIGTGSGSVLIALPAGANSGFNYGEALNNSGQVVGYHVGSGSQVFFGTTSATAYIPPPTGLGFAGLSVTIPLRFDLGIGMNDSGQIVATTGGTSCCFSAALGTTAGSIAIPLPSGATIASVDFGSLNKSGVVVGQSDVGGWIWDTINGTRLLNTVVPSGWNVTKAISVSNNGLILAYASHQGGASQFVELIPTGLPATPAPSTLALVLIGVGLCWVWRIRSNRTRHARS